MKGLPGPSSFAKHQEREQIKKELLSEGHLEELLAAIRKANGHVKYTKDGDACVIKRFLWDRILETMEKVGKK